MLRSIFSPISQTSNLNALHLLLRRSLSDETRKKIDDAISNNVCLFMKGTPERPQCGFSQGAVRILDFIGVKDLKSVDVLEDAEIREGIKSYSDWPTIPQLYIKGQFVGGTDLLMEMLQNGELEELLVKEKIISPKDVHNDK